MNTATQNHLPLLHWGLLGHTWTDWWGPVRTADKLTIAQINALCVIHILIVIITVH